MEETYLRLHKTNLYSDNVIDKPKRDGLRNINDKWGDKCLTVLLKLPPYSGIMDAAGCGDRSTLTQLLLVTAAPPVGT